MKRSKAADRYSQLPGDSGSQETGSTAVGHTFRFDRNDDQFRLEFIDTNFRDGVQRLNLDYLLAYPELAEPFAQFLGEAVAGSAIATRTAVNVTLRSGFFAFLCEESLPSTLKLSDLSQDILDAYFQWLGRKKKDRGFVFSVSYRRDLYAIVRSAVRFFSTHNKFSKLLARGLHFRRSPWSGAGSHGNPANVLDVPTRDSLYSICVSRALSDYQQLAELPRLLEQGGRSLPAGPISGADYRDFAVCLAALASKYPNQIPGTDSIASDNKHLANAINYYHGRARLLRYLYPSPIDLVPYVCLLALQTSFNCETILTMSHSEVSIGKFLGVPRIHFQPKKRRAHRKQRRSFEITDAPDSPAKLIDHLKRWTARLRPIVRTRYLDRIFLFAAVYSREDQVLSDYIRSYDGGNSSAACDPAWKFTIPRFIKSSKLPSFSLRQLRPTSIDLVAELFRDDLRAIQAASGHRRPQVYLDHYKSSAAQKRNDERIADVIALRSRWVGTKGQIDVRDSPSERDLPAATPGFRCFDPYSSPMPGQFSGKLCSAFGRCPLCPLAHADILSPYALAALLKLKAMIADSQRSMAPARWLAAWAPVQQKLSTGWLPHFRDKNVIKKAETIELPEFPSIE